VVRYVTVVLSGIAIFQADLAGKPFKFLLKLQPLLRVLKIVRGKFFGVCFHVSTSFCARYYPLAECRRIIFVQWHSFANKRCGRRPTVWLCRTMPPAITSRLPVQCLSQGQAERAWLAKSYA